MARVRFLADANLDQNIVAGVIRRQAGIEFELPQGVIAEGIGDPEVLAIAASRNRVLVTHDIRTMPRHFAEFITGSDSPGVILIPRSMPMGQAIEDILLIWHISDAEEWRNLLRWLPL
jgi:hypothetical protein